MDRIHMFCVYCSSSWSFGTRFTLRANPVISIINPISSLIFTIYPSHLKNCIALWASQIKSPSVMNMFLNTIDFRFPTNMDKEGEN